MSQHTAPRVQLSMESQWQLVDTYDGKDTAAVHKYNPTTDSWDLISNMPTARCYCLVAVLLTNEVIVVGGITGFLSPRTDKVELASISSVVL